MSDPQSSGEDRHQCLDSKTGRPIRSDPKRIMGDVEIPIIQISDSPSSDGWKPASPVRPGQEPSMTPKEAARTASHARRLLTAHILTPHDYVVLDAMLWRLRRPGRADLAVDYRTIARLAGVCRDAAINSVRKLADIGLVAKIRRRVRVAWGRGCVASRQIANGYVFRVPVTESPRCPADAVKVRILPSLGIEKALAGFADAAGVALPG